MQCGRDRLGREIAELGGHHRATPERLRDVQTVGDAGLVAVGASEIAEVGARPAQTS